MTAEAGAEASGCPGTVNAIKGPLNRAEQEGALGRRPVAEEVSPQAGDNSVCTVLASLARAMLRPGWGGGGQLSRAFHICPRLRDSSQMSQQGGKLKAGVGQNELRSWIKFRVCVHACCG